MHTGLALKDSCVDCLFAAVPRQGDITMGDFWGISKFNPKLNDGLGTSVLLTNNTHGEKILSRIKNKLKKVVIVRLTKNITNVDPILLSYCNSGTVLYNLELMRRDNITLETYKKWLEAHEQTLLEEQLLNNTLLGRIYHFMPFDYNYHIGSRKIYDEYCKSNNIVPKKAIIHYFEFRNDSPIVKPWDAYEYFYENKRNTIFSADLLEIYKKWWDYALHLEPQDLLPIIDKAKSNKYARSIRLDRDKWRTYSDTFKYLAISNLLLLNSDEKMYLANMFISKGYKHIAIYGDTEITKVLCKILKDTEVKIDYIVENAAKPVSGFKTVNRNPADYPDCDVMLIADIYYYNEIKTKLEKLQVPFPFYNAAEFIQSLPAVEGDGVSKIKAQIRHLNEQIVAGNTENKRLSEQLAASAKNEAVLSEKVSMLTQANVAAEKKLNALSVKVTELSGERDRLTCERNTANAELQSVQNSLSFKLGRFITFIPRKIRDAFKKLKK